MKKLLFILTVTTAGFIALPSITNAEETKPGSSPRHGDGPRRGPEMNPEARLKMMTEKLGLTQEQQDKIKAIFEKNAAQMKELMAKGRENLTAEDKTKLEELRKSQREEIDAVLTAEQKEKAKAMHGPREHGRKPAGAPGQGGAKPGDTK